VEEAAAVWRAENPLPSTLGRVCPHPCEDECNRSDLGGAITIHMIERYLGDRFLEESTRPTSAPPTNRSVAVVGAGPAGIAAAYHLALKGHAVDIYDDKPKPGGYLRTGIPDYRLPKSVLDAELALVEAVGVNFHNGVRVGRDVRMDELRKRYDAVVIAVGMHGARQLGIPGEEHPSVFNGVKLLESILLGERPSLPDRLAIIGGGNTAMDVARSLLRLGVTPIVLYRRTRNEMPAIAQEIDEALAEGIEFHYLTAPKQVVTDGDRVVAVECIRMELGEPDESGRRRPVPVEGSEFRVEVAGVVTALGETGELEFLPSDVSRNGRVETDARFATSAEGVFAAGDIATGEGTVTAAVGTGRRVAHVVDAYLSGTLPDGAPAARDLPPRTFDRDALVSFDRLNTTYMTSSARPGIRALKPEARIRSFAEVVHGFTEEEAIAEARRCLLCGTCNECQNCLQFCPDVAIHNRGGAAPFDIDYDHCKGCGICVEECPRDALTLVEVTS
jgi:2-oxoacid:acceptor oxidoreductase delta subunit (pyruvate/2-ketoisovalerate family)